MTLFEEYNSGLVTWSSFAFVAVIVAVVYAALLLLRRRLDRGLYLREADGAVRSLTRTFLLLIDPLAALILLAVFVAIAPFIHGLILLLLVAVGLSHIRHYIDGRVLRLDPGLQLGKQLSTQNVQGTLAAYGLTSLYLQRERDRVRLPYATVLREGYTVANDPAQGGYFHVQVLLPPSSAETTSSTDASPYDKLCYLLADSPYIKADFLVQRVNDVDELDDEAENLVELTVGVHRADHVRFFLNQLREAGYTASLTSH